MAEKTGLSANKVTGDDSTSPDRVTHRVMLGPLLQNHFRSLLPVIYWNGGNAAAAHLEGKVDQQERAGLRKCPEAFQGTQEGKEGEQLGIQAEHEASTLHPRMRPGKISGREEVEVARQIYVFFWNLL